MPSASTPVLVIKNLVKDVGPVPALEGRMLRVVADLSLTARAGEVTALLGVNGAGKTTTLECAQGLQKRTGGDISLLGEDPDLAGPELRSRVGVMLQDGGLPPSAHPIPLLRHVARMYEDPWPVDDLVSRLNINEFARTNIRRLSGGQKQRLALAAALLGRPEVLFLDEPSAGMDPQSRQLVFELISELRDSGMGIILTTHLMDDAEKLADYVYIIAEGTVVSEGTVPDLLASQTRGETRSLVFEGPTGFAPALPSGLKVVERPAGSYQVQGVTGPADLAALAQAWEAAGFMPASLRLDSPNLEDVFLTVAAGSAAANTSSDASDAPTAGATHPSAQATSKEYL